jgi:hypothetical protein
VSLFLPDQGLDSKAKFPSKLKGISVRSMAPHDLPFVGHGAHFQTIFLHARSGVPCPVRSHGHELFGTCSFYTDEINRLTVPSVC